METKVITMASHEFGTVRKIKENNTILYCGSDVAKSLGYNRPNDAITAHCRYTVKRRTPHPQSKNKTIEMSFIPEGDVWRLICHSKLPNAEQFEKWIFDDVVPTVAKTGKYEIPNSAEQLTLEEPNYPKAVLESAGYRYQNKTFNGEPVVTLNDIAFHIGVSPDTARGVLRRYGKYGKDYYKIEGAQIIKFKQQNTGLPHTWNHLILVTKSGFMLIANYYNTTKNTPQCFLTDNKPVVAEKPKTNKLPSKPTTDEFITALNVMRYIRATSENFKAKNDCMADYYDDKISAAETVTKHIGMMISV